MSSEESPPKTTQSLTPLQFTHLQPHILTRYVTDTGKILPRRMTGLTAKQQRYITRMIKRARNLRLMM
ncbi:MAG: 30S ribosomal protein S18 [Puniceicoccaceae bacterium]|nr:MAG: 30S ribosomal protein S18 [Puniceicoccaceae bacterium]